MIMETAVAAVIAGSAVCSDYFEKTSRFNPTDLSEHSQCVAIAHDLNSGRVGEYLWLRTGHDFTYIPMKQLRTLSGTAARKEYVTAQVVATLQAAHAEKVEMAISDVVSQLRRDETILMIVNDIDLNLDEIKTLEEFATALIRIIDAANEELEALDAIILEKTNEITGLQKQVNDVTAALAGNPDAIALVEGSLAAQVDALRYQRDQAVLRIAELEGIVMGESTRITQAFNDGVNSIEVDDITTPDHVSVVKNGPGAFTVSVDAGYVIVDQDGEIAFNKVAGSVSANDDLAGGITVTIGNDGAVSVNLAGNYRIMSQADFNEATSGTFNIGDTRFTTNGDTDITISFRVQGQTVQWTDGDPTDDWSVWHEAGTVPDSVYRANIAGMSYSVGTNAELQARLDTVFALGAQSIKNELARQGVTYNIVSGAVELSLTDRFFTYRTIDLAKAATDSEYTEPTPAVARARTTTDDVAPNTGENAATWNDNLLTIGDGMDRVDWAAHTVITINGHHLTLGAAAAWSVAELRQDVAIAVDNAFRLGWDSGYDNGYEDGFDAGYEAGYTDGFRDGRNN